MLVSRVENNPPQTKICSGKVHFNFIVSFLFILSPFLAASNTVHLPAHPSSPSTVPGSVHTSARLKSPLSLVRGLKTSSILSSPDSCILLFSAALCWSAFCHSSSRWPHLCPEHPWHPKLPFTGLLSYCCTHAECYSVFWPGRPSFGSITHFFICLASEALCVSHVCIK